MHARTNTHERSHRAGDPVRVRLLGGFRVSVGKRESSGKAWSSRKASAVMKLLCLAPGYALHREQAMDTLWPNLGRRKASNNLRQALHSARKALHTDQEAARCLLASSGERIALCPDGELWADTEAFEAAARGALRTKEPRAYEAALDLYTGELLPEDRYEDWTEAPRARLRKIYLSLLFEVATLHEGRGDYGSAEGALDRVLIEEPANEGAHTSLMRLYAIRGRRSEALSQYERLKVALLHTFGVEPSASVRALREEISSGRFPPPDAPRESGQKVVATSTNNLPSPRTSFVGREREVVEVKRELAMTRLLTLTGTGGAGKTRLALEVARDLAGTCPEGAWFVDLAPLSEPEVVPQAVAAALEVREEPGRPLTDTLADVLSGKNLLVLLDNCEHLIEAAADLVDVLLGRCPGLRVVATSREPLGVEGEVLWRVPPLSVPQASTPSDDLHEYAAVRLFVDRACLKVPAFGITRENAGAVCEVCRRLEGVPLAVELAAARMGSAAVEQLARRLDDALAVLSSGPRTASPRQRTMRATLQWSFGLLSEKQRAAFRRLSGFAGGFTLEAAEAVLPEEGLEEAEVLDLVSALVDKSLLIVGIGSGHTLRYRMLEPVWQFAREKLEESGEAESMKRSHAEYFLTLAEEAEPELKGPDQVEWLVRLEAEHDNMRAALSWALQQGEAELAIGLGDTLWSFWYRRGYHSEGRRWLEGALAIDGWRSPQSRAMALGGLGMLAVQQGDVDRVQEAGEEGLELLAQAGSEASGAKIYLLSVSGYVALIREDYERATRLYEESLPLSREMRDDWALAFSLFGLALVSDRVGDPNRSAELYEESIDLFRQLGDKFSLAFGLNALGLAECSRGDLVRAEKLTEESVALLREQGAGGDAAAGLHDLGWMALLRDDLGRAADLYEEALTVAWDIERNPVVFSALEGFACLAGAHGEAKRAARLWGAAQALHEAKGIPRNADFLAEADDRISVVHSGMGEEAWEEAWREGRAMTTEEAVRYAFSEKPASSSDSAEPPTVTSTDSLTHREQEIAKLVARGLTNHQIASELFISDRTVATHLGRVFKKLKVHAREQIGDLLSDQA